MPVSIILLYEVGQIASLTRYLASLTAEEREAIAILAIGADIEFALEKLNIPFRSGRGFRTMQNKELILFVEKLGREILDDPSFFFFRYRGVRLGDIFMPALQNYFLYVLYFVDLITTIVRENPNYSTFVLFSPSTLTYESAGVFALLEGHAAIEAARFVGSSFNFKVVVPFFSETPHELRNRIKRKAFGVRRALFGYALAILNSIVSICIRPKKIRILASDYWRNMSPLLAELPESELIQLDREESRKSGFAAIFRHRMRFVHIEDYVSRASHKLAEEHRTLFIEQWEKLKDENIPLQNASFHGQSLAPLLIPALKRMVVRGGFQAVSTIEGVYALYARMKPDVVWVRASVSAQIHFPILCHVSKLCGIPSIEIQHGILYLGPGSFINRPAVEYIATYGPLASTELKKFGYHDSALPPIGSPRFDVYKDLPSHSDEDQNAQRKFRIVCIAPAVLPQSWSDTYQIVEYFRHLAEAASVIPNAHVTIKLRPGAADEQFFREAIARSFGSIPYTIAQRESLVDVLSKSDVVIAIYSTTVLEGLISGRPVIYDGYMGMHQTLGAELAPYEAAGALVRVHTTEACAMALERFALHPEIGENQVQKAREFMSNNYAFDGGASQRLADFLKKLASREAI